MIIYKKTFAYEYKRVDDISVLNLFGFNIYKRVGSIRRLFGIGWVW